MAVYRHPVIVEEEWQLEPKDLLSRHVHSDEASSRIRSLHSLLKLLDRVPPGDTSRIALTLLVDDRLPSQPPGRHVHQGHG